MTDPSSGRDGTQAPDGPDALAPLPRGSDEHLPGLSLPALPVAGDRAAVARWMDADAAATRRATDPPAVAASHPRVREAGPPRLLPRDDRPRPTCPTRTIGPDPGPGAPAPESGAEDSEPEWLRERREEHEFRSQFGEWRPGARPVARGRGLSPVTLLMLLGLVVLVVVVALS